MGIIDRRVLDAAVARVAQSDLRDQLLLRGSYLTSHWVGTHVRKCDDLDFLSLGRVDLDGMPERFVKTLSADLRDGVDFDLTKTTYETIFADSVSPGVRIAIPYTLVRQDDGQPEAGVLQVDIAFKDPLPSSPSGVSIHCQSSVIRVLAATPELAFAWKLHGLVEREGLGWRAKDLADLWLIQNAFSFDVRSVDDVDGLSAAIKLAFDSRDGPIWRLDRLIQRRMGTTSGSRRRYQRFLRDFTNTGDGYPKSVRKLVDDVAGAVEPHYQLIKKAYSVNRQLKSVGPFDFPVAFELAELHAACGSKRYFASYDWVDGGVSFVRERIEKGRIAPHHAATNTQHRTLMLQREARGITFDKNGTIIARPYAEFDPSPTLESFSKTRSPLISEEEFSTAEVLEKLDGSMVFPTPNSTAQLGWTLRTRRGRSEIADRAMDFANESDCEMDTRYIDFVSSCLQNRQTPVFEWCSRSRWIVFDHPCDRLVLTGIRCNETGSLCHYSGMKSEAETYGIEIVDRFDKPATFRELLQDVLDWTDREGCVVRLVDHRQIKLKSHRYRWLHQAVEGPSRDRARWFLWATGAGVQLKACSAGREIDLENYLKELDHAATSFALEAASIAASTTDRKQLAKALKHQPALVSRLGFFAFDGQCVQAALKKIIATRCQSEDSFQGLIKQLKGPVWNDN